MSVYVYISEDEDLEVDDTLWENNSHVYNNIFHRAASFFRHFENEARKECFLFRGEPHCGIDLTYVKKDVFNIFCLRFQEAFLSFPDIRFHETKHHPSEEDKQKHILWIKHEWEYIINMLKKDKRYDPEWIKEYEIVTVMKESRVFPENKYTPIIND